MKKTRPLLLERRWRCYSTTNSQVLASLQRRQRGHWDDINNQRLFLDDVGKELNLKGLEDWYGITRREIEQRRGGRWLFYHYPSLGQALKAIYPEFPWQMSRFSEATGNVPSGHWKRKSNLLAALSDAEQKLGIKQIEDWYSVTLSQLREIGFPSQVTKTQFVQLLREKYPNYQWEQVYLLRGKYGQQKRLERTIQTLFPDVKMILNARKEADLINPVTGAYLELDVYLPSLCLAFEYQDIHHYKSSEYAYKPLEDFRQRDEMKKELAKSKGITLILVPCWWDGTTDSLVATIQKARPDLLISVESKGEAIPEEMPSHFLDKYKIPHVEGIGEPITACFLTGTRTDPTNWWMFEKYDGVRGFWNPEKRRFFSRNGNPLSLPTEIVNSMPADRFLDGELWFGRDNFEETAKISNKTDASKVDWEKFKYMVFDMPNHTGTYQERYNSLETFFKGKEFKYMALAPKVVCKDSQHLESYCQDIIEQGGEGIILRNPSSPYQAGRSPGFLKHKKFRDAEAKIISAAGAHEWECMLPNGVTFIATAGTAEFVKRWTPKVGDIVSFKHRGYYIASKRPKLPSLYRIRTDLTWENVVNNWKEQKPRNIEAGVVSKVGSKIRPDKKPTGYWLDIKNRQKFFYDFAAKEGFDPVQPENWNSIQTAQILSLKGGKSILAHYNDSLRKALQDTFPELDWKFEASKKPKDYWKDPQHCREFFTEFARERGIDPTSPESWDSINLKEFLQKKGARSIKNGNGGFRKALEMAYPEIQFSWLPTMRT